MANCAYTKIAAMQLFYELKQKYPTIPDQVVTDCIQQNSYDKAECERELLDKMRTCQVHCYPPDMMERLTGKKQRPKTLPLRHSHRRPHGAHKSRRGRHCDEIESVCKATDDVHISSCERVDDVELDVLADECGCERTSVQVRYKKHPHSAPTTPSTAHKPPTHHRTSLSVEPRSHASPVRRTRVGLTLRPPAANGVAAPIDVATRGSQLEYSTSTFDGQCGYQRQLQISIGSDGTTTLAAVQRRTVEGEPTSLQGASVLPMFENALSPVLAVRLQEQKERKHKLEVELIKDRTKLESIKKEVISMELELQQRKNTPIVCDTVLQLRAEVRALRIECEEINAKIFRSIENADERYYSDILIRGGSHGSSSSSNSTGSVDCNLNWTCHMCTFKNHPMLRNCEQCDMACVGLNNIFSGTIGTSSANQISVLHPSTPII